MTIYLGHLVCDLVPTAEAWQRLYAQQLDIAGAQYGRQLGYTKTTAPRVGQTLQLLGIERDDASSIRTFVTSRGGKLCAFWLPTYDEDLVLTQDHTAGTTLLTVHSTGYTANLFPSGQWRRHLALWKRDGTREYKQIVSSTDGGFTETLTLSSGLTNAFSLTDSKVSFLTYCRFDTDSFVFEWLGPGAVRVRAPIIEIPTEVPGG